MKVFLETFGCQMNRLDSELITGRLTAAGHEMVSNRKAAEVVLYNTCSVRAHAEEKVYSRIGADEKRIAGGRSNLIVGVLGCMAQREGNALRKRFKHVRIICAPGQLHRLTELISAAAAGQDALALDPPRSAGSAAKAAPETIDTLDMARDPQAAGPQQAYVRVMRGCDNFCTYCIVPFVRGPEVSRDPSRIVQEITRLVDSGISEVTLLGQTVNRYRWDGTQQVRFSDLLALVSAVSGLRRLRFVTSYPLDFGNDVLEAMRDLPNVCEYIHCPAQSGSDTMLKRMNRKYTRSQYDDFVDRARAIVPGVTLAGDFIVGFPGETEEDHHTSEDLIRRSGYKNCFVFKYSPRPGTPAERKLTDDVPEDVKRRRNNELLAVQAQVGLVHHRSWIGRRMEVLVEGPSPRSRKQAKPPTPQSMQLTGRTQGDHIAVFNGPRSLIGQYVTVTITDADSLTLMGELTPCPRPTG